LPPDSLLASGVSGLGYPHICVASAPQYLKLVSCNCARILTVATLVLKAAIKLIKVMSHGNDVCDIIIGHMRSVDTQTKIQTDVENVQQS